MAATAKQAREIDEHSLGPNRCEIVLCKILAEMGNPRMTKFVTRLLHELAVDMHKLSVLPDAKLAQRAMSLMHDEYKGRLAAKDFPPQVMTHARSCLAVRYRKFLPR